MDDDLARRAHSLFMKAVEVDAPDRRSFIESACAADAKLRERVAGLLAAFDRSDSYLERPALERPSSPSPAPLDRKTIGDYRIVRVVGAGGMATVFEAIQRQPRRRVALKIMRHGLAHTSALRRFEYEAEVLARLQHPGIAQIFEAGAWDDGHGASAPFFVMEYIQDARTLTAYAEERGLSLAERLQVFVTVCDAVQHGHQHGVIHRDLKPANVLVDAQGRPKVIDFGVARSSDPEQTRITLHSDSGSLIGTLNYMSPEQCSGVRDLDIRTDVYSLGVILYELVCRKLPHDFSQAALPDVLHTIRFGTPTRPAAIESRLRGDLDAIVMTAIDKDRERRYATVAALAADIRRFLHNEPIEARPPTVFHHCRLFVRRHRALVGASAAVLIAIVIGAVIAARYAYQTAQESKRRLAAEAKALEERDTARWQAYVAHIAAAFSALRTGEFQQLRTRLASASEPYRGWEWSFLAGLAERSERTVVAHDDMISAFAASPDGTRLATGARDGMLRVWDADTLEMIVEIEATPHSIIASLAFSPDAARVVSGSGDQTVRVWDARTGEPVHLFTDHERPVGSVSWGRHGLIASAARGELHVWNADSGQLHGVIEDQPGVASGVAFSSDGTSLITWSRSGSLLLRSSDGGAVLQRMEFDGLIEKADISADGSLIAAGGSQGRITVWTAHDGQVLRELGLTTTVSTVRSLAFSPDARLLAAGQIDRGITIWSLPDGTKMAELPGHEEAVSGLWFTPDGDQLLSTSWDRTIRLWCLDAAVTFGQVATLAGHEDHVLTVAFSPDGALLASGGRDQTVRLWDPELGLPLGVIRDHRHDVFAVAFSPDGRILASGAQDRTARLWSAATGAHLATLDHEGGLWSLAFSPNGNRLATGGNDDCLCIWDIGAIQAGGSATNLHTLPGHTNRIIQVAFSPDGAQVATSSRDHSVRLWNAASGGLLHVLAGHESDVFAVTFSRDGRRLYSGSRDQTVRVWSTQSGECLNVLGGQGQFVTTLSASADGTRLAAGSWFGEIVLWDLASHDVVASFQGHENAIRAVAFDPSGRWLASGAYDREIRLRDATPTSQRQVLRARAEEARTDAQRVLDSLAAAHRTVAQLAEAVEADNELDHATRTWLRRLILKRALEERDVP